jgi:holliday junction DNA helicase RuvB
LDKLDIRLLKTLIERFQGSPVGLNTIADAVGEEPQTIEEVYEPYLLQLGMIKRTPRGRVATERAYQHFGLPMSDAARLF